MKRNKKYFDRWWRSYSLKLKSIGVDGSMLSIYTEFLSDCRQRVVVDGASSKWIPIIPGVQLGSVLGPLLCILDTSEIFDLIKNRLFAPADGSTPLSVVR